MKTCVQLICMAFVAVLPSYVNAQQQLIGGQADLAVSIPTTGHVPRWTNNLLTGCDHCEGAPIIYTTDRRGYRETVAVEIPGAGFTTVRDVASGVDGSLAAVGLAISGDSRMGTFLDWVSPDRTQQVITRFWPYSANVVTVAPDGTIWTVGEIMNDNYRVVYPNVLRHYASSGQLLASTVVSRPRAAVTGTYKLSETSTLMASNDRIGWMTTACQYFEYSFDGVELGRYDCPAGYLNIRKLGGVALSPRNDVIIDTKPMSVLKPVALDRQTKAWKSVRVPPPVARPSAF
jgi:hypothetical protein